MNAQNRRLRIYRPAFLLVTAFLIFAVPSSVFPQRGSDDDRNELALILGARVNGFKILEKESGDFYIQVQGATNPETGKKLEGSFDLAYRCANVAAVIVVGLILAKGYAERQVQCRIKENPYLYY